MANLIAVDNKIHHNITVDPSKAELHGEKLNLIPVVVTEFSNVALEYPIVFTKNGDTGRFVCTAMLGFEALENLFWQNGTWQGLYLPLQIQRQPFFVSSVNQSGTLGENNDYAVCIDENSPTVAKDVQDNAAAQALFTASGEDTEYFAQAKTRLAQLLRGEQDNERLISCLQKLDLLQPLSLEITFANKQSTRLNGLYTINQDKLAAVTNEQVTLLFREGLLQPIYTMITSLGHIYSLIERKNQRLMN